MNPRVGKRIKDLHVQEIAGSKFASNLHPQMFLTGRIIRHKIKITDSFAEKEVPETWGEAQKGLRFDKESRDFEAAFQKDNTDFETCCNHIKQHKGAFGIDKPRCNGAFGVARKLELKILKLQQEADERENAPLCQLLLKELDVSEEIDPIHTDQEEPIRLIADLPLEEPRAPKGTRQENDTKPDSRGPSTTRMGLRPTLYYHCKVWDPVDRSEAC